MCIFSLKIHIFTKFKAKLIFWRDIHASEFTQYKLKNGFLEGYFCFGLVDNSMKSLETFRTLWDRNGRSTNVNFPMMGIFLQNEPRVLYISFTTDKNLKTLGNPTAFFWRFLLLRQKELKCGFLINFWSVRDSISKVYLAKDDVSLKTKEKIWHDFKETS